MRNNQLVAKIKNKKISLSRLDISLFLIGLIGVFLRFYQYIADRSLWIDEAMLAINFIQRSYLGLQKELLYAQAAPFGFLLLEKLVVNLLGSSEYALRLVPLAAGLTAIPSLAIVSKKFGSALFSLVAASLFSFSPFLIYYSSEVKQYSSDVLLSLLILWAALKCLEPGAKRRAFIIFGVLSSLAAWFSHPALFEFAGLWLALALFHLLRKERGKLPWLAGAGLLWAANLALAYLVFLRYTQTNPIVFNYWRNSFAPLPPWLDFQWYPQAFYDLLINPLGLPGGILTVAVALIGIGSLGFKKPFHLLLLVLPLLGTLAASALHIYPFRGRVLLFLVPAVLLIIATGLEQVWSFSKGSSKFAGSLVTLGLIIFLLFDQVAAAAKNVQDPPMGENMKAILVWIQAKARQSDSIYVFHGAEPAYSYYAPRFGLKFKNTVRNSATITDPAKYLQEIAVLKGRPRVWVVFSHMVDKWEVNNILDYLDRTGQQKAAFKAEDAAGYLYDLSQK